MTPQEPMSDALCACCAQPTPATTFPAICAECHANAQEVGAFFVGSPVSDELVVAGSESEVAAFVTRTRARLNMLNQPPSEWLASLTVSDARFLHALKIDPLG